MGAYSTVQITREDALKELTKAIAKLGSASNEELEDLLETFYGERKLYNFSIVPSYTPDGYGEYYEGLLD